MTSENDQHREKRLPEVIPPLSNTWWAPWTPEEPLRAKFPKRGTDYRDSLPDDFQTVVNSYAPYIKPHRWTFGLFDMWSPKAKLVKHSVHIPCWDSYKVDPRKWRGLCFGRTLSECYWTGLRQIRWARAAYGGALGTEYLFPVQNVGKHGHLSDIQALCWLYFSMSCLFSLGIGQVFSLCGNIGCNFGACYSCHAREKMRRRFGLPPAFGLPPGIDDCAVHFLCFYCSSHQELRELVVRGIDGPGLHILDVLPNSFRQVEGYDTVVVVRQATLQEMAAQPPHIFQSRLRRQVDKASQDATVTSPQDHMIPDMSVDGTNLAPGEAMGWRQLCCPHSPPPAQSMDRETGHNEGTRSVTRSRSAELADRYVSGGGEFYGDTSAESHGVAPGRMERAWSIAY